MESRDLRVGNYVKFEDRYFQVDTISKELPTLNTTEFGIGVVEWNQIKPIQLTEEILLKCGFERHSTNPFWFRKKQICISLVGSVELISWDMQIFKVDLKVEYLHQLQNLFFALTNEELNVQL